MNRDNDRQTSIILAVLGILPIVWLGLLIAPSVKGGLPEILPSLMNVMSDPFHIVLCEDSVKTVLVLLLCYGMGIGIYFSTRRNYRRREEHGSAKWGNAKAVDKKYRQNPPSENKLMTQAVRIGLNGKRHRRNLNTLVCGGSGAFLTSAAIAQGADIYITGDYKYHDFFQAENRLILTDIGHYESEQFTKEIFYELVTKKISNFAIQFSKVETNPIHYL